MNRATQKAIAEAYERVVADKTFQFGWRGPRELTTEGKLVIVEMYERMTGVVLLPDEDTP
jgi:hypothetical protein